MRFCKGKTLRTPGEGSAAPVFKPEQIMAIIDLACKDPCDLSYKPERELSKQFPFWLLPLI